MPLTKLSEDDKAQIRREFEAEDITRVELAARWGISYTWLARIVNGSSDAQRKPRPGSTFALTCDRCGVGLRRPADICGFCEEETTGVRLA